MGQAILYCWKCQNRVLASDLAEGRAFQTAGHTTCRDCAGDLALTLEGRERQDLLSKIAAADGPAAPSRSTRRVLPPRTPAAGVAAVGPRSPASSRALWGLAAGVGIALVAVLGLVVSGRSGRTDVPVETKSASAAPTTETEAQRREKAADLAIRKARKAADSGKDLDGLVRLWTEAVAASESTSRRTEAQRERDAALARQKEDHERDWAQIDSSIRGLETRREFRKAAEFLKSARKRHDGAEWAQRMDRRLAALEEKEKAAVIPTAGLALWLRADAGVDLDGPQVSRWRDQSDAHHDASQDIAGRRPTLLPDGLNGRPCLRFDGKDSRLDFEMPVNGLTEMTIILVSACDAEKKGANGSDSSLVYWDAEGKLSGKIYLAPYQTGVRFKFGTGLEKADLGIKRPESIQARPTLTILRKEGTVDSLYTDGTLAKMQAGMGGTIAACSKRASLGIGKSNTHFSGCIAELLVYTRALPEAERNQVERNLAEKYRLTLK